MQQQRTTHQYQTNQAQTSQLGSYLEILQHPSPSPPTNHNSPSPNSPHIVNNNNNNNTKVIMNGAEHSNMDRPTVVSISS